MNNNQILELLYIKKDYSEIKESLKNSNDSRSFNMLGKIYLWEGNLEKAYEYFSKGQSTLGCTYFYILNEQLAEAKVLINMLKDSSPALKWLSVFISLLEDRQGEYPTYFQIRNFYEQDLELLFIYKKTDYIDKIFKKILFLEYFNREIYKFTARVFLNNNMVSIAEELLKKSLDVFYNDPETHFLLGEIKLIQGNSKEAIKSFEISTDVNNGYLPAINKLKDLRN